MSIMLHTKRIKKITTGRGGRRGSILLLVVGLLAIIGMLGTTFLLVSRLDRKQAEALALKVPVDHIAEGIVAQMVATLKQDLYINDGGTPDDPSDDLVYGATSNFEDFLDYASDNANMDEWLWYDDGTTTHLSDVLGIPAPLVYDDTDGDTTIPNDRDAYFVSTNVTNYLGEGYFAAVRVIDLSALINTNIAWAADQASNPLYDAPVLINLRDFINDDGTGNERFDGNDRLNYVRGDGGEHTPADVHTNIALQLFSGPYKPFAIGDEMYLRWLTTDARTETGRLFDATYNSNVLPAGMRRYLTTFNCSRALVRVPAAVVAGASPAWKLRVALRTSTALDDPSPYVADQDPKQALYDAILNAIGPASPTLDDKKKAAHLVANTWAYIHGQLQTEAYAFQFTDGSPADTYTVYGLIPQPVITEAFARYQHDPDSDPLTNDFIWGHAIEIYNPSSSSFDLKLLNADDTVLGDLGTVAGGGRIVFFNVDQGGDGAKTEAEIKSDLFGTTAGWVKCDDLDFSSGNTVRVGRVVVAGSHNIPLDEIAANEVGPAPAGYSPSGDADLICDSRRDKSAARYRYNVAEYKKDYLAHALGTVTGTGAADLSGVYQGFWILPKHATNGVVSLGEMFNQYLTGPIMKVASDSTVTISPFPQNIKTSKGSIFRGRAELIDGTGAPGATCMGDYPAVPQASILGEFFEVIPPDTTRGDDTGFESRIYGKVNINTATRDVLFRLPWPATINTITIDADAKNVILDYIIAYRDKLNLSATGGPDYSGRVGVESFITPGEVAIPLADYSRANLMGTLTQDLADYLPVRDELYSSIANVVTVNSDTFAVYILVEAQGHQWNYVAVIDRSNCRTIDDSPAVLLFSPVK